MGPPGLQAQRHQASPGAGSLHGIVGPGLGALGAYLPLQHRPRQPANGLVHTAPAGHRHPLAYRQVGARQFPRPQLVLEPLVGVGVLGHRHEAGGSPVQPVHRMEGRHQPLVPVVGQQKVGQRVPMVPLAGVDGDAPLLLHHHQVLVLIADGQGTGNRRNLFAPRQVPHRHREKLSRPSCLVGKHRLPVQQNAVRQGLGPPDTGGGQQKLLPEQGVNGPPRLGLSQAQGQTAHRQTSSLFSGVAAFFVVHFPYDSIPKEVIR